MAELQNGWIGGRDVSRVGPRRARNTGTGILYNCHVVNVAGIGDLTAGVVNTVAAKQENIIVGARTAQAHALRFSVITDFKRLIDVLR